MRMSKHKTCLINYLFLLFCGIRLPYCPRAGISHMFILVGNGCFNDRVDGLTAGAIFGNLRMKELG